MPDQYGTVIFPDGRRFGSTAVSLDEYPHSWSGRLMILDEHAEVFAGVLPGFKCTLRLDDGRVGTILLWHLKARTWFQGLGPLAVPTG